MGILHSESLTKKWSSEILANETYIFGEKYGKFSQAVKFSEMRLKSEVGEMHHWLRGMDAHEKPYCSGKKKFFARNVKAKLSTRRTCINQICVCLAAIAMPMGVVGWETELSPTIARSNG